jgi:hypothetical protein
MSNEGILSILNLNDGAQRLPSFVNRHSPLPCREATVCKKFNAGYI